MANAPMNLRLVNQAELSAALRRASIATGKLPAVLMNRAVMSIAIRARKKLKAVDGGTIRAEWGKEVPYSGSGPGAGRMVPLGVLVLHSRVNAKTGIYKAQASPFAGVSQKQGRKAMKVALRKILGARLRSKGYFRACASAVMTVFRAATGQAVSNLGKRSTVGRLGNGKKATGTGSASATFWVSGTRPDEKKKALFSIAEPAWQAALNAEAQSLAAYAAAREYKNAIRAVGLKV
jgi:hypothetical protein